MNRSVLLSALLAALAISVLAAAPQSPEDAPTTTTVPAMAPPIAAIRNYEQLTASLRQLAADAGPNSQLASLGKTAGGREVWVLRLAAAGEQPPEQRLAVLIVGSIDAEHPASSEIATRVAEQLVAAHRDEPESELGRLLAQRTFFVLPRVNVDGVETYFEPVRRENRLNARPVDEDRDGLVNEDGPNDLDGNGLITVMRVPDPAGEWMPDPDEPRLLRRADPSKGERGLYTLHLEGIDNDNDGLINEDGPGGIDSGRNWPHLFESGVTAAGIHALSAVETRALTDFVLANRNIAAAIVYGRHDTVARPPQGKDRDATGRAYRDLHPDDHALYRHISEHYKTLGERNAVTGARPHGALYAWLYSQQGIPTFALRFGRVVEGPKPAEVPEKPPTDEGDSEADAEELADDSVEQEQASAPERPEGGRGRGAARGGRPQKSDGGDVPAVSEPSDFMIASVESTDLNKRRLKWCDANPQADGFIAWADFDHATLGVVQIGGFAPHFASTPPPEDIPQIAERQARFVRYVCDALPAPRFGPARVRDAGAGVWQVELRLVNESLLPTHLAIARHIGVPPIMVRPDLPPDRVVGGPPGHRVESIPGGGGAVPVRWLIRGQRGDKVTFRATHRTYGEFSTEITLAETP